MGVELLCYSSVVGLGAGKALISNNLTGDQYERAAAALVTITGRLPVDGLFEQLRDRVEDSGIASLVRIGDCLAPSTIQQAVYSGHKWARELDEEVGALIPRELPMIQSAQPRTI
jgi:dimethylamine/trimethylamine dehydrogenase